LGEEFHKDYNTDGLIIFYYKLNSKNKGIIEILAFYISIFFLKQNVIINIQGIIVQGKSPVIMSFLAGKISKSLDSIFLQICAVDNI